jgi:hypothetical protein
MTLDDQRREEEDAVSFVLSSATWDANHDGFHNSNHRNSDADHDKTMGSPASQAVAQPFPVPKTRTKGRDDAAHGRHRAACRGRHRRAAPAPGMSGRARAELKQTKQMLELLVARTEPLVGEDGVLIPVVEELDTDRHMWKEGMYHERKAPITHSQPPLVFAVAHAGRSFFLSTWPSRSV